MGGEPWFYETVLNTAQKQALIDLVAEFVKGKPLEWLRSQLPRP